MLSDLFLCEIRYVDCTKKNSLLQRQILSDPVKNNQLLTEQLQSLGLYAASTLGDGNCLFRALSDQLHGTPSHHLQLRAEICDWIETYKQRYEPFCEDERGLAAHLRCMREQGIFIVSSMLNKQHKTHDYLAG